MSKYQRTITGTPLFDDDGAFVRMDVDVYDVLLAFGVTCPATQHAIKKLLCPGQRGHKDKLEDLNEAVLSVERAITLARKVGAK